MENLGGRFIKILGGLRCDEALNESCLKAEEVIEEE